MQRKTNLRGLDVHHVQNGTHGRIINGKLFIEILSNGLFHTRGLSMTMGFASMYISRLIVLSRSHNLLHPLCFILSMLERLMCRLKITYLSQGSGDFALKSASLPLEKSAKAHFRRMKGQSRTITVTAPGPNILTKKDSKAFCSVYVARTMRGAMVRVMIKTSLD